MLKVINKSSRRLSSVFKLAVGFIFSTLIMKFILGYDAAPLIEILSKGKVIHADALLQAVILLIQTLVSLPLCVGLGVLLIEVLDIFTNRKDGIN
ncbi:hypothetical protein L3V86_08610 [Thiotrichales bacterium 19S11-10]|nr:hypothetical protein [Thiotrichales bacterium 19S11-10]